MDTIIVVVAWASMILTLITALGAPLLFGKERAPYSYSSFINSVISAVMVWLLALKALGYL